jgi:hypothetical protein
MCDRAKWCIVDGPCSVHDRYPNLQPPQIGPLSAAPGCTAEDRKYIGSLRFRVTVERVDNPWTDPVAADDGPDDEDEDDEDKDDEDEDDEDEDDDDDDDDPDDDGQSGDYGSGR